mmetsp:Transcript_164882/g.529205  ORF Transcript_164882/g.529205 Transcript_164882/m.529205 type:complete len:224 (+) Transcript_164882:291-962(+)
MSSTVPPMPSSCCHRFWALLASFSAAPWQFSGPKRETSWTALAGSSMSHTPSEQIKIMCSSCSSKTTSSGTSGSEMRPTSTPSKSPMDRDIAKPNVFTRSLEGPLEPPGRTWPPQASILASSSFRSGLWFSPNCRTSQVVAPGARRAYTMEESPTNAHLRRKRPLSPSSRVRSATEAVVPEARDFSGSSAARERATSAKADFAQLSQDSHTLNLSKVHFGRCS